MKKYFITPLLALVTFFIGSPNASACTNFLVTKGASADGSVMISYNADSHLLYGELYHWAAGIWPKGTMMDVYDWDSGKYLGKIEQAHQTYNVIGNMNENQVAIGETTFGGRPSLQEQPSAVVDYGSLIYLALQRSKSARDAIKIMTSLVAQYGYYSEGESFSISDKDEAWILEMISKGKDQLGAVWVARRIPDGYVSGHANQARITTFPLANGKTSITFKDIDKIYNKDVNTVYSDDVISFARQMGWFKGSDKDFSFSDTYAPVDFEAARFCEIRVWAMFNEVKSGMKEYWDYAKGDVKHAKKLADGDENVNNYATNRMPLWVKPDKKVTLQDMMHFMRNHLEGTELDMSQDIGAGPFHCPYRWRPLTWKVNGKEYVNERATATQQTGFTFIAQSRSWLPDAIGGIIWWGVDDASGTVYMPIYACTNVVPENFKVGNGSMMEWSDTSGFWIFNQVENFAYTAWDRIHPDIEKAQNKLENEFIEFTPAVDAGAQKLYAENPKMAVDYLTQYSNDMASKTFKTWKNLYHYLFMRYMDGNIKTAVPPQEGYKYVNPKLEQPGYDSTYYQTVVKQTGDKLLDREKK
ncbi:MAG: C69 family dipeptidase [Bacteroidales bacterium]|nr:C69 family dipeptidase [Bacteroidales bacterium]